MGNRSSSSPRLATLIETIDTRLAAKDEPRLIVGALVAQERGRTGFSCGAYTMSVAGVRATCTSSHEELLRNWQRHARRALAALED